MKSAHLIFPLILSLAAANPESPAGPAAPKAAPPAPAANWEDGIATAAVLDGGPAVAVPVENAAPTGRTPRAGEAPRLFSPYPVKLLSPLPDGWRLARDPGVPARRHKVTLSNGKSLEIGVTAPVLQPCLDGATVMHFPDGISPADALAEARRQQTAARDRLSAFWQAMQAGLPPAATPPAPPPDK